MTLVAASTLRNSGATDPASQTAWTTQIPVLYVQSVAGKIVRPVSHQFMADMFGVALQAPMKLRALWPVGHTEPFPVRANDFLVLPASEYLTAGEYVVYGVRPYPGRHLTIYIDVPTS